MHVMEDDCNKSSAASTAIENLPKTNGSPTPCQKAVPALESGKKAPQENGTDVAEKDEQLEASEKPPPEPNEEQAEVEDHEEDAGVQKQPLAETEETKAVMNEVKEEDNSCDGVENTGNMSTEVENLSIKKTEPVEKSQHDDACSLPPYPEDEDSANSSPESHGVESKHNHKSRQKRVTSDSDSDSPAAVKKMKYSGREFEERDRTVNEYVENASRTGLEEIQKHVEKLQQEIHTLSALARAKEHEWNNIIRLKKVKEEMYLRLQRRRQVILLTMGSVSKPNDTLDWDLSSDMRFGEFGVEDIPSSRTSTADSANSCLKITSSKVSSKEQSLPSQFSVQQGPNSGVSLLKNNQNQLGQLMMVPIVSSGQGGLGGSLSAIPSQSGVSGASLKVPDLGGRDKSGGRMHRPILPKPTTVVVPAGSGNSNASNNGQNPIIGEGRQGPILDVRSIIADYRSRHPETVPRRGRRLKSCLSPTSNSQQLAENLVSSTRVSGSGGILSMASLALGSGSQMRTGLVGSTSEMGDISFLLNAVGEAASRQETSRPSSADSSRSGAPSHATSEPCGNTSAGPGISFKDVLVQFAKLSQNEQRHEPLPTTTTTTTKPPPYPEVTLHPVIAPHSPPHQSPSSSLLHGILTKSNNAAQHRAETSVSARPTTFSPTLARLLTAPERLPTVTSTATPSFHGTGSHVSISDLLSTSKTRNEITITPVAAQPVKAKEEVPLVEEEQEDSADRLVIDESGDADGGRSRENEDDQGPEMAPEDVPECQGCHQRAAQFVCAGCGNQWYCSRECQVSAWDEHSEVCSG